MDLPNALGKCKIIIINNSSVYGCIVIKNTIIFTFNNSMATHWDYSNYEEGTQLVCYYNNIHYFNYNTLFWYYLYNNVVFVNILN